MADVAPMDSTSPLYVAALDALSVESADQDAASPPPLWNSGAARPEPTPPERMRPPLARALPRLDHDAQPGLDKATAQKMRRGKIRPQRRLDLHGLTQDEARRALTAFLRAAQEAGCRDILVITGKGVKKDGSIGVLRARTPGWLNAPENRGRIVAFSYAAPKDGGEGALYIRLKKASA
ncbi:Smr/MutS family protein [Varunaivibrio sulfuroxidans]|nr:Smr/MutS family protein [Varunaivibrio sulfuroxidans]